MDNKELIENLFSFPLIDIDDYYGHYGKINLPLEDIILHIILNCKDNIEQTLDIYSFIKVRTNLRINDGDKNWEYFFNET